MSNIPAYIDSYERLGFGLFLHWGLYSQLRQGEWALNYHYKENPQEYSKLFDTFNADDFDADALVQFAQQAGCRYICLTTRHHEGFSLYDTRGLNTYDAPHSPAGRDLVAEFAEACDKYGMGKFFYHTTLDWWHQDFHGNWDAYQQYLRDSVDILCTHYGKVDGLWFDGNWAERDRDWQEDKLYDLIRSKQPECIIVNNSSHGHHGEATHPAIDVVTYEQGLPSKRDFSDRPRGGEMCDTMNSHWGVGDFDLSYQNPASVIQKICSCRRFRANLLMNIGPTPTGGIPAYEREVFNLVGRWMQHCPAAIYDAKPTELACRRDDFVLQDGTDYYYFCHNLSIRGNGHLLRGEAGNGLNTIAGDLPTVKKVTWLDNDEELAYSQQDALFTFQATAFPYGRQMIVRIAKLETA